MKYLNHFEKFEKIKENLHLLKAHESEAFNYKKYGGSRNGVGMTALVVDKNILHGKSNNG